MTSLTRSRIARLALTLALAISVVLPAGVALAQGDNPPPPPPPNANGVQWSGVIDSFTANQWVVAGQAVSITDQTIVRITGALAVGMWADVQAVRSGDTLVGRRLVAVPPEMSLRGEVTSIPEGRIGQWIIGGQPFQVTADTAINDRGGPIVVGSWVHVVALQQGDVLTAQRIRSIEPQPAVEVLGAIQVFTDTQWTVSGLDILFTPDTLVTGEPRVGLLTRISAELQEDNSLEALRVRVLWHENGGPQEPTTLTGAVEQLPAHGLVGQWEVEGTTVVVGRNVRIDQRNGLAVVGAEVRIVGHQTNNVLVAREITVISSPVTGQPVRFGGVIEALPASGLLGNWIIGGQTVQVTETTRLQGERFFRVGAMAQVTGLRQTSGVVVAFEVKARPPRPNGEIDLSVDVITE